MNRIFSVSFLSALLICGCKPSVQPPDNNPKAEPKQIVIGIIPFHSINSDLVEFSAKEIRSFYGVRTEIMKEGFMPDSLKKPYPKRYNANKIIEYLNVIKPQDVDYLLGLTTQKIATKKGKYKEWGILGLGQNPGPCCIVSTANMGTDHKILLDRLAKVCLHEMGHNFGLPHCISGDNLCLMRDARGTIKTVDSEKKHLCNYCKRYLNSKGFRINEQYQL